jgi:hypothetical protein
MTFLQQTQFCIVVYLKPKQYFLFSSKSLGIYLLTIMLGQGVKYISAWWNIKKVLRKEPTGEHLSLGMKK